MTTSLVLHIGDPKTGSSSIQQALFYRRLECASVTVDYPAKLNAIQLANSIRRAGQAGERDQRFRAASAWLAASQADVAVLSAEQFSSIDAAEVAAVFDQYMPRHSETMRVVAYARPHVSRFMSAYAQRVKVGSLHTGMQQFLDENLSPRFLNFSRRFLKWRDAYGDRFVLRPMVREELRDGDVVADFVGIVVQNAPFRLDDVTQANTTLPVEALSGLRLLQEQLAGRGVPGGTLQGVGSQINRLCGEAKSAKGTKLRLGRDLYDRICEMSRKDAERLDETFFGRSVMVKAMDQSGLETADQTSSTEAGLYFSGADLAKLRANGAALADLFLGLPDIWKESYQRKIGQLVDDADVTDQSSDHAAHIAQVNAILAETAALISLA